MNRKLNISALVLSASLASGTAFGGSNDVPRSIEKTKGSTFEVLSGKENMKRLKREIEENTGTYHVRKNDTIASIADRIGISTEELLDLNAFLDTPLTHRWKAGNNILIRLDQTIFIPKDTELFKTHINQMSEYAQVGKLNKKVREGKINEIDIAPIFASSVQSIGLPNLLSGFIQAQQNSYDPILPRVVDRSGELQTSCANAMRTSMVQAMNFADLSPKEQAFQRKQNIDAWMLPTELMNIGYEQRFPEIMGMFDPQSIGSAEPIKREKMGEYQDAIKTMYRYLEKNGDSLAGGYVPYYFKRSHYKGVVADYNRGRKDKHYNTHQSMFAGNISMQFGVWNVPLIRDGKMESFGADTKNIAAEIDRLKKDSLRLQAESVNALQKISPLSQGEHNPEITKKLTRYVAAFDPLLRSLKWLDIEAKKEKQKELFTLLREWNETKAPTLLEKIQKIIPAYKITSGDLDYLGSFVAHHYEMKRFIGLLQKSVSDASGQPIDGNAFGLTITNNGPLQQAIQEYNVSLGRMGKTKTALATKEALLKKPAETISVIDFIVNFVQSRADFGWALSDGFRQEIYNGLSIYGDLLHISINGKAVDIPHELELSKHDRKKSIRISPEDTFEISGPLMIDGEKQANHPDPSRQKRMNIRTRLFFEFIVSGTYLPTELLVPGKDSSYARRAFSHHSGKLKVKGVYGLRMKYDENGEVQRNKHNQTLSENIEEVLRREIVKYENLNPDDPRFEEKLHRYYAFQIKALQVAGFLQDENTLNRSAVNINRAIPYFDPSNIAEVFASYIRGKKQEMQAENGRLAEIKNYIDVRTLPGDTYRQIFASIVKYTSVLGGAGEAYPRIQGISRLEDYKKRVFVERFLSIASREPGFEARKFLENPKPYKSFILSLDSLETLLGEMGEISYTPVFPGLSETDQKVIELVSIDESYRRMLANILAVESYGETGSVFSRRNLKKLAKRFWYGSSSGDYQLRISSLLADLENDKTLEVSMENIFRTLRDPEAQSLLHSFEENTQSQIQEDLRHIDAIKKIVAASPWGKLPKKMISDELSSVMRFDSGNGSNVVGKIISASLLIDKLALHSEKLDYMLVSAGYDLPSLFDDSNAMQQYERAIIRINNLPENHMLLALTENFIIRLSEWVTGRKIETRTVFNESVFSKGKYLGQIRYDKNIFLKHIRDYRQIIELGETNPKVPFFLKKLDILITNMTNNPANTNENIYMFLRDKELRSFLEAEDIEASLLPLEEEWNNDSFRSSVFHYVNKMETLRRNALGSVTLLLKKGETKISLRGLFSYFTNKMEASQKKKITQE